MSKVREVIGSTEFMLREGPKLAVMFLVVITGAALQTRTGKIALAFAAAIAFGGVIR